MIVDKISNIEKYNYINLHADKIVEFIKYEKENNLEDGSYDILGDDMFAQVQTYETKDISECKLESHKKYIDVQYIIKGKEIISWTLIDDLIINEEIEESDIIFYEEPVNQSDILMEDGYFAVFLPHDVHRPRVMSESKEMVKKIVFKIKY